MLVLALASPLCSTPGTQKAYTEFVHQITPLVRNLKCNIKKRHVQYMRCHIFIIIATHSNYYAGIKPEGDCPPFIFFAHIFLFVVLILYIVPCRAYSTTSPPIFLFGALRTFSWPLLLLFQYQLNYFVALFLILWFIQCKRLEFIFSYILFE